MKQLVMNQILAISTRIEQAARTGRHELWHRLKAGRTSLVNYLRTEHRVETVIHPEGRIEFLTPAGRDAA